VALVNRLGGARRPRGAGCDVTLRAPATTLSLSAAPFGVFYTAVVVSQFVGLAQGEKRQSRDDE